MRTILNAIYQYQTLSREEACEALLHIASGHAEGSQVTALLSAYIMRRPTIAEMEGFRQAMMECCVPLTLPAADAIDIVGTGGDGKNTFNISTLSALITAAAGIPVIKHGNVAATSVSGSSDVLHYLGYRFTARQDQLQAQLEGQGICFLHAPLFHPAMQQVAQIRKDIGVRTFFNLLGPLINPAQPAARLLGVNSLEVARCYHYMLQSQPGTYTVIHSLDGYDEASLTGTLKAYHRQGEALYSPGQLGFQEIAPSALYGGASVKEAAALFLRILQGKGSKEQRAVVLVNSALAISCARPQESWEVCVNRATTALDSGAAYRNFKQLISSTS